MFQIISEELSYIYFYSEELFQIGYIKKFSYFIFTKLAIYLGKIGHKIKEAMEHILAGCCANYPIHSSSTGEPAGRLSIREPEFQLGSGDCQSQK